MRPKSSFFAFAAAMLLTSAGESAEPALTMRHVSEDAASQLRQQPGKEGRARSLDLGFVSNVSAVRVRAHLYAKQEGQGELLSWGDIAIKVSYRENTWSLLHRSSRLSEWSETEFNVRSAEELGWLDIDIVRESLGSVEYYSIFVNGASVVAAAPLSARGKGSAEPQLLVHPLDFADIDVEEWGKGRSPEYASRFQRTVPRRALKDERLSWTRESLGIKGGAARPESDADLAEETQRKRDQEAAWRAAEPHHLLKPVEQGSLSFSEEIWYRTRTANREYFEYSEHFSLKRALQDAHILRSQGADYLPGLESRDWADPTRHADWNDGYIEKITGYIVPESTGPYLFWLSADEQAGLWLSSDDSRKNLDLKILLEQAVKQNAWTELPAQRSVPIALEAGMSYYFEIWHVEQDGGDHLAVAWTVPGDSHEQPTERVPSGVISSEVAGAPGTYPRNNIYIRDESLQRLPLVQKPELVPMSVSNGVIVGNQPILHADFAYDDDGWLEHATTGNGLGWVASSEWDFPGIWWNSGGSWIWYEPQTANPQWFYRYDLGIWLKYGSANGVYGYDYQTQPLPSRWSFENAADVNSWVSDTGGWWQRNAGTTTTQLTGPNADKTLGTSSGYYMHLDASSLGATTGVRLTGPWFKVPASGGSITFYYHMYGNGIGSLKLVTKGLSGVETIHNIANGQQHGSKSAAYSQYTLDLYSYSGSYVQIAFLASASSVRGDTAIDDIIVYDHVTDSDGDRILDRYEALQGTNIFGWIDSDGDGMADDWERYFFGSTTGASPTANPDGDGLNNLAEFLLGSHPGTSNSAVSNTVFVVF